MFEHTTSLPRIVDLPLSHPQLPRQDRSLLVVSPGAWHPRGSVDRFSAAGPGARELALSSAACSQQHDALGTMLVQHREAQAVKQRERSGSG